MENLYKIKEALWKELEKSETARSGELKGGELEAIHKLTDTITVKVMAVIDDLMDALQVVNKRSYDNIIKKINQLDRY